MTTTTGTNPEAMLLFDALMWVAAAAVVQEREGRAVLEEPAIRALGVALMEQSGWPAVAIGLFAILIDWHCVGMKHEDPVLCRTLISLTMRFAAVAGSEPSPSSARAFIEAVIAAQEATMPHSVH